MERLIIYNVEEIPDIVSQPEAYFASQFEETRKYQILGLKIKGNKIITEQRIEGQDRYSEMNIAIRELNRNQYYIVSLEDVIVQYKQNKIIDLFGTVKYLLAISTLFEILQVVLILFGKIEGSIGMDLLVLLFLAGGLYTLHFKR